MMASIGKDPAVRISDYMLMAEGRKLPPLPEWLLHPVEPLRDDFPEEAVSSGLTKSCEPSAVRKAGAAAGATEGAAAGQVTGPIEEKIAAGIDKADASQAVVSPVTEWIYSHSCTPVR